MVDMRGGITARGIRGSSIWAAIVVYAFFVPGKMTLSLC